ncbi:hypothetical protein K493DRAFT_314214 [Basidiobolus meristosporus CBS 931.73]|uniref:C2H2-type domain-containing protein n=1 Tax=Basidiobolus meristosporus CBS 931.73 TaxID=1314790 RepID=A0A1Y1YGI0_9FUNG|nr:hypothetical protein K493DRAFT_314214 [Basidiobolus meristosporus CBS 931.73]|eukprot:ORX97121.1 hypothetical protein K493DRAFT_314214 [Basidiobolus meristosporus CBS 931.73]
MSTFTSLPRSSPNQYLPGLHELFSGETWYSKPSESYARDISSQGDVAPRPCKIDQILNYTMRQDISISPSQHQSYNIQSISTTIPLNSELPTYDPPENSTFTVGERSSSVSSNSQSEASIPEYLTPPGQRNYVAKRHTCHICFKRFPRPSSLRIHIHTHTGEKPYQCSYPGCLRRFSVLSNLRRHTKTHTT